MIKMQEGIKISFYIGLRLLVMGFCVLWKRNGSKAKFYKIQQKYRATPFKNILRIYSK